MALRPSGCDGCAFVPTRRPGTDASVAPTIGSVFPPAYMRAVSSRVPPPAANALTISIAAASSQTELLWLHPNVIVPK